MYEAEIPPPSLRLDLSCRHHLIAWATGAASGEQYAAAMLEIDRVRRELADPNPNPAEGHLAEIAALCWFALRAHEIKHAQRPAMPRGYGIFQADGRTGGSCRYSRRWHS